MSDVATTEEAPVLWRVWFDTGYQWELREAVSSDAVYKSFKAAKRRTITRVDRVYKTSERDSRPDQVKSRLANRRKGRD